MDNILFYLAKYEPLILFLTLSVIIWYACETRGMKRQMIQQKELSIRPFIVLSLRNDVYMLNNIGYGPALDIKLDNIAIVKIDENITIAYSFENIDFMSANETRLLNICCENGNPASDFDRAAIMPQTAVKSFDFKIIYHNLENKAYSTSGKLGMGGVTQQKPS